MSTLNKYRGVTYEKIDGDTFRIRRQIVNGIKIPELEINVKFENGIFTKSSSVNFLIDNLIVSRENNGVYINTHTGKFYNNAYDQKLTGEINFTDIGNGAFRQFFGFGDNEPNTAGNFQALSVTADGKIGNKGGISGEDYIYNFDVFKASELR